MRDTFRDGFFNGRGVGALDKMDQDAVVVEEELRAGLVFQRGKGFDRVEVDLGIAQHFPVLSLPFSEKGGEHITRTSPFACFTEGGWG